jgi:hypothetical protein
MSKKAQIGEWIEISSDAPRFWTKIIMQGRGDGSQWVTSIKVKSKLNDSWSDVDGGKTYGANYDKNSKVDIVFEEPVYARVLTIYPQTWYDHISLRFEAVYSNIDIIYSSSNSDDY